MRWPLVAPLLAFSMFPRADDSLIGDVLQVVGNWHLAGKASPLVPGAALPARAIVEPDASLAAGSIVVVLLDGKRLAATCSSSPCQAKIQLPATYVSENVSFKSIVDAVAFVLLNRRPEVSDAYAATSSRSLAAQQVEMVVPFPDLGEIPLNSFLAAARSGRYLIEVWQISKSKSGTSNRAFVNSRRISWDGIGMLKAVIPGPGLYLITIDNEVSDPVGDIFVAALPSQSEPDVEHQFQKAQSLCVKWAGPDAEVSVHLFLRAYLLSIAEHA